MIIPLIEEILSAGLRLFGDKESLISDYIGYTELIWADGRFLIRGRSRFQSRHLQGDAAEEI